MQEKHSGFNYQCLKCKKLFSRKNYKHGCVKLEKNDLDLLSPKGVRGEEAYTLFRQWKNKVQPTLIKTLKSNITTVKNQTQKRKITEEELKEFELPGRISPLSRSPKRKLTKFNRGTETDSDNDSELSETEESDRNGERTENDSSVKMGVLGHFPNSLKSQIVRSPIPPICPSVSKLPAPPKNPSISFIPSSYFPTPPNIYEKGKPPFS